MCIYVYIYIYTYLSVHTYMWTNIYTYICIYIHMNMSIYTYIYIHIHIYTYIYIYIHIYIYTHTHMECVTSFSQLAVMGWHKILRLHFSTHTHLSPLFLTHIYLLFLSRTCVMVGVKSPIKQCVP